MKFQKKQLQSLIREEIKTGLHELFGFGNSREKTKKEILKKIPSLFPGVPPTLVDAVASIFNKDERLASDRLRRIAHGFSQRLSDDQQLGFLKTLQQSGDYLRGETIPTYDDYRSLGKQGEKGRKLQAQWKSQIDILKKNQKVISQGAHALEQTLRDLDNVKPEEVLELMTKRAQGISENKVVEAKSLSEEIKKEIRTQLREANGDLWAANLLSDSERNKVNRLAMDLNWDPVLIAAAVVEMLEDSNMHSEAEQINRILLPSAKKRTNYRRS